MSENKNMIERHGCIVCGKLFDVLAVYSPDRRLLECKPTSSDGHCLTTERQQLVACNDHTEAEIQSGLKRWRSAMNETARNDQESD